MGGRPGAREHLLTRREFVAGSLGVAAGAAGLVVYSWQVEPHWLEVVERPMAIAGLPPALMGSRLVQLSDIHVGRVVSDAYLLETFQRVAALRPDILVLTGDFISFYPGVLAQAKRIYADLPHGRLDTLAVLGNHDYGRQWADAEVAKELAQLLVRQGVRILRNETTVVGGLQIAGVDDLWAKRAKVAGAVSALDPKRPAIALVHNPDTADLPGWEGFRGWILAGHTHGGQVRPLFLDPPQVPVLNEHYISGAVALSGGRNMYINRGVGHLIQVRFNARPEVAVFTLVAG